MFSSRVEQFSHGRNSNRVGEWCNRTWSSGLKTSFFFCNFKGSPEFLLELTDEETMGNSESAGLYPSKNFPLSISKVLKLRRSISKLDPNHLVEFSVGIQEEPHIFH